jgi:hypothetical protein
LHLENFHLSDPNLFTRFVTWTWILIYTLVPVGLVLAWLQQRRVQATNQPSTPAPLSIGLRSLLILHGATGLLWGILLLLMPQTFLSAWGWVLTPLTARALSAWLIAYGLMDSVLVLQNDRQTCKVPAAGYLVSSSVALVALFRYSSEMNWSSAGGVGYLAFLACMLGVGLASVTGRLR